VGIGAGIFHFNGCGYGVGESNGYAPLPSLVSNL
jgi:isopropylmalate/homocitrate/citramalate synthase